MTRIGTRSSRHWLLAAGSLTLIAGAVWLASCGGGTISGGFNPPQGTISVSISDPPSCKFPAGSFQSVFVTVRSVMVHISGTAGDSDAGWHEIAPNLATAPIQLDLLAIPTGGCVLAMLGSNVSLPAGDYQQIRLILLPNNPAPGEPVPANNACSSVNAFNCAVLDPSAPGGGGIVAVELSSQANTGLKVPPGQIVGGPIRVAAGQHVDLNIDFNVCASLVRQGNNQLRLLPTLTAGQVSSVNAGISGRVLDSTTLMPVSGGQVQVALEQPDSGGVDRIIMQAAADSNGNFNFCPVPAGTYDVVVVGQDGSGVTYGATIITAVDSGVTLGDIPLIAQVVGSTAAAAIAGAVTSENAGAGVSIDAALSAFQTIPVGGNPRPVTIPLLTMSVSNIATAATPMDISVTCPANTFCEGYSLVVPAQNPSFGAFVAGGTSFSVPVLGDVNYSVEARAFRPMSGGVATCTPSSVSTTLDATDVTLKVSSGLTTTAKQISFTACM
ncbi:MAG: DUF4382 domain-containing protein [Candidatus Acidiferrales bacterium]